MYWRDGIWAIWMSNRKALTCPRSMRPLIAILLLLLLAFGPAASSAGADDLELRRDLRAAGTIFRLLYVDLGPAVGETRWTQGSAERDIKLPSSTMTLVAKPADDEPCRFEFGWKGYKPFATLDFSQMTGLYKQGVNYIGGFSSQWIRFYGTGKRPIFCGQSSCVLDLQFEGPDWVVASALEAIQFIQAHRCSPVSRY